MAPVAQSKAKTAGIITGSKMMSTRILSSEPRAGATWTMAEKRVPALEMAMLASMSTAIRVVRCSEVARLKASMTAGATMSSKTDSMMMLTMSLAR